MLVPMSKERFVARMLYDSGYRVDRKKRANYELMHYLCERRDTREHRYHRDAPKRSLYQ